MGSRLRGIVGWGVCLVLWVQCKQVSTPKEYMAWIQDPQNGLLKTVQMGGYTFQLQYEPTQYVLLKRHKGVLPPKEMYEKEVKELETTRFFTLSVSSPAGKLTQANDPTEYKRKWSYYSFGFQQDLFLEENNQREPCVLYYFDHAQDQVGTSTQFVLGFQNSSGEKQGTTLCIDSDELGIGIFRIHISEQDLQKIPELAHS